MGVPEMANEMLAVIQIDTERITGAIEIGIQRDMQTTVRHRTGLGIGIPVDIQRAIEAENPIDVTTAEIPIALNKEIHTCMTKEEDVTTGRENERENEIETQTEMRTTAAAPTALIHVVHRGGVPAPLPETHTNLEVALRLGNVPHRGQRMPDVI